MLRALTWMWLACFVVLVLAGSARAQSGTEAKTQVGDQNRLRARPPSLLFALEAKNLRLSRAVQSGLNEYLAAALTERGLRVVFAPEALAQKPLPIKNGCADQACREKVTRHLGFSRFLVPEVLKVGSGCTVLLRLYSVEEPGALRAATGRGACAEDALMAGLDQVLDRLTPRETAAPPAAVRQPEELSVDMGEGRSERPAVPPAGPSPQGETGRLSLNSVPWGRVWIDGRDTGQVTPLTDFALPVGRRQVEVRTEEGEVLSAEVEIWADESSTLILRSSQGGAADGTEAGWLSVNTRPWSEVTVDGKHVGMTPLRHRLLPGKHQVRLGFAHGEVKTEEVTIQPGRTARLVAEASTPPTFQFKKGMGLLKLHSSPWGRVWIDGKDSGKATPLFDMQLPDGTHRLTIHFATGGFMSDEVLIRAGETTRKIIRER